MLPGDPAVGAGQSWAGPVTSPVLPGTSGASERTDGFEPNGAVPSGGWMVVGGPKSPSTLQHMGAKGA